MPRILSEGSLRVWSSCLVAALLIGCATPATQKYSQQGAVAVIRIQVRVNVPDGGTVQLLAGTNEKWDHQGQVDGADQYHYGGSTNEGEVKIRDKRANPTTPGDILLHINSIKVGGTIRQSGSIVDVNVEGNSVVSPD